jgi:hypothetical protein
VVGDVDHLAAPPFLSCWVPCPAGAHVVALMWA